MKKVIFTWALAAAVALGMGAAHYLDEQPTEQTA